jgi:hypothetical protein
MRQRAVTAVHEAAHAVAACRYRRRFHSVHVGMGVPILDRRGRSIEAMGLCDGGSFDDHRLWSHISESPLAGVASLRREEGFRNMVLTLAGPVAEARHKRQSLASIYLGYGRDDFDEAQAVAKFLAFDAADEEALFQAAEVEAKRCVSLYRKAIADLADALIERGTVEFGDQPASVRAVQRIEGQIAP